MLGAFRTISLTRFSHITLLATMAFYTTDFTTRPYPQNYDIFYHLGT
jgi:hypothetical protein